MPDSTDAVDGSRTDRPIGVFISYAHENDDHVKLVERVADVLAMQGMTVFLDNWRNRQRNDWNELTTTEIENSDYVVAVASKGFREAAEGKAPRGVHRSVRHEISVMRDLLQEDRDLWFQRIIPLVLEPQWGDEDIPRFLQPITGTHVRASEASEHGLHELIGLLSTPRSDVTAPARHRRVKPHPTKHVQPPRRRGLFLAALVAVLIAGTYAVVQFGPPFASGNVGANSTSTPQSETGGSVVPSLTTSRSKPAPKKPRKPPVADTPTKTVTVTTTTTAAPAQPAPNPPCSHSRGDGIVIAAASLQTTTSPPSKIGEIRLCRDASQNYWAHLVRYQSLPAGQWVNGTLDRWDDGHFSARFSCAATAGGASGVVTAGLHECWTQKVPGTDPTFSFYAFTEQCDGVYDDRTRCTAKGSTARRR